MKQSAGILLYRFLNNQLQVFLVHPGGPFWKNKDLGVWTIPKGEFTVEETPLTAAIREFQEETGKLLSGNFLELSPVKQKSGKLVYAWAIEGDIDPDDIKCNTFKMEWPPKSGKWQNFPEVEKGEWFTTEQVKEKIIAAQLPLIDELQEKIK